MSEIVSGGVGHGDRGDPLRIFPFKYPRGVVWLLSLEIPIRVLDTKLFERSTKNACAFNLFATKLFTYSESSSSEF